MRPWLPRRLAIALLIAASPAIALAAQTFQRPGTAAPKPSTPSAAAVSTPTPLPGRVADGTKPAAPRSMSAEEQALNAIREDAVKRVEALMRQATSAPEGAARSALLRQVVDVKRDAELRFLQTKADFARGRGDLAAASRIESLIEARRAAEANRATARSSAATATAPGKGGPR